MNSSRTLDPTPVLVEFSLNQEMTEGSINPISRDDIMEYVEEMCTTLSYLSAVHDCDHLSGLLAAAATVAAAERGVIGRAAPPPVGTDPRRAAARE